MTDDLSTLLAKASTPPPPPMEQFLATIPASAGGAAGAAGTARRLAWLPGFGVAAAAALVVVAGGASILSLRPDPVISPAAEPLTIAASDLDLLAEEAGYSESDAFAATLSGDLVALGIAESP